MDKNNPKDFWNKLKPLGPRKKTTIPIQVRIGDEIITEGNTVLNKWKNDFSSLYNNPGKVDNEFY